MAMPRSRGVRSLTTRPPMRMSPEVGSSRPAIIRSRVVFPEPEGPRRTRNSPSRLCKSTLLTAPTFPRLKILVRFLVSTTAIAPPSLPLREDAPHFLVRRLHRGLRRHLVLRRLREHRRDDEGVEHLVDRRRRVARVADVRRPIEHVAEDRVLVRRD